MTIVREETIGDCRLIQADCLEVLPTLKRVDALITDPPFGIGFKYASHDDNPHGYGEWLWPIIETAESLLPDGAPVFVWQAMRNVRWFATWFPRDWRIYAAAKNFVQMRPTAMQYAWDPVLVWWKGGVRGWSAGTASRDFYVADTAPVVANNRNLEKRHPCPRPLDQVRHIVNQWAPPESTVLDPFMGSGTTGVACAKLGRRFIGIEIDPGYFDIAVERIREAYRQPDMFTQPAASKAEQLSIDGMEGS
jgi:DNA modification methylase